VPAVDAGFVRESTAVNNRFDFVEKITLLAYISMLQMRIEQEVMEGQ